MTNSTNIGKYYEYKHGGIYQYLSCEKGETRKRPFIVSIKHVWPFEEKVYIKDLKTWLTFAKPLTEEEVKIRMSENREEAQKRILEQKNREVE